MIREATAEDMPALLDIAERFFAATGYAEFTTYSPNETQKTLEHLIEGEDGIILVLDLDGVKGVVGGLVYPFYMSGDLTGQELFWWSDVKSEGLSLLDAVEAAAKEKGAKTFTMMSLDNLSPERLDKIYLAKGYTRSEHTYIRSL